MVDDGSTDGTSKAIQEHFPNVNIIPGDGNLYWNRGMHLAWNIASKSDNYEYYLWLNDDTMIHSYCISTLLESSNLQKNQIIVGTTNSLIDAFGTVTYGGRDLNNRLIIPNGNIQECQRFNGNIVLIPKYVFDMVGFNDEYFHHGLGDFDYGLRALKLGVKSFIAPQILGTCERHDTLPTWCNPERNILDRFKHFSTPTGAQLMGVYTFEKRHYGAHIALYNYINILFRVLFPKYWI